MKKTIKNKLDKKETLLTMIKWARGCGNILNKHLINSFSRPVKIIDKGEQGFATQADLDSEIFLIKKIKKKFPSHQIISEEDTFNQFTALNPKDSGYTWLIDPLDGTNNFYNKISFFAVSIALLEDGIPVLGVILNPVTGDLFYAHKGVGAWMERKVGLVKIKKKIKLGSSKKIFKEALLSANLISKKMEDGFLKKFPEIRALRRLGSAALEMSYVSVGMLDAYWEYNLQPWDMAAAGLICSESGAKISTIEGEPHSPFKPSVLVSHPALYESLLDVLKKK